MAAAFVPFIVLLAFAMVSAQPPLPEIGKDPHHGLLGDATTMGQVLVFAGTVLSTWVALYVQSRNRRWDLETQERQRKWEAEDRQRIADAHTQRNIENARMLREETAKVAERVRDEALRTAQELKAATEQAAARVADTARQSAEEVKTVATQYHAELASELKANTEISKEAFLEANRVNQKIARIGALFDAIQTPGVPLPRDVVVLKSVLSEREAEQRDQIQETVEDNNRILKENLDAQS